MGFGLELTVKEVECFFIDKQKFIANIHYAYQGHWLKKKRIGEVTRKLSENKECCI